MRVKRPGSTQSRVFEAIRANGRITIKGLQEALGLPGGRGYARISRACTDLMKSGYIGRVARGTYGYIGEPTDLDYSHGQKRMVRVIRIRTKRQEPFTARKLSELSECSLDWSKRYVRFLVKKGLLERVGFERLRESKAKTPTYLGIEERLNEEWPAMRRQRKTGQIDDAVAGIREAVFRLARDCQSNRESLLYMAESLNRLGDMVNEALGILETS